jgi:fructose-bisphosphate aldolase, class II
MSYVNTNRMLSDAMNEKYVIGAFNIVDFNSMAWVINAAKRCDSPVIIQTSQKTVLFYGYALLSSMIKRISSEAKIDIAMNLDHGTDIDIIRGCIENGWSSVMIDGSSYSYEDNIRISSEIVKMAHGSGVSVEAELGHIGGKEEHIRVSDGDISLTDPYKVMDFKDRTKVDSLAVAIGTRHGIYGAKAQIDLSRLEKIINLSDFPIVIHGCSGLDADELDKIIKCGPSKMNISTELKHAYLDGFRHYLERSGKQCEPLDAISIAGKNIEDIVEKYIRLFGSSCKDRGEIKKEDEKKI